MEAQQTVEQVEQLVRAIKSDPDVELWAAPHPAPQEWSHADPEDTGGPGGEPGSITIENSMGERVQVRPEHVLVWTHLLDNGPDKFNGAVARVLPNGTLLVTQPGSEVPLKGYAPGAWLTFEHIGEQYHTHPVQMPARGEIRRVNPSGHRDDDTQSLPQVGPDQTAGGGVERPKGSSVRAGSDGHPDRPRTGGPDRDELDGLTRRWSRTRNRLLGRES